MQTVPSGGHPFQGRGVGPAPVLSCGPVTDRVSIVFTDVAKRYDERVIFRSVSGAADPGEVLVISGPNGSGKSTLLAILCGLLRATRGSVQYTSARNGPIGRDAWRFQLGVVAPSMAVYEELDAMENLRPASGRPVATPSQDIVLGCNYLTKMVEVDEDTEYDELDAMEHLRSFARVRGLDREDAALRGYLGTVGLDPDRRTTARGFSTGMLQRLKIAQAMLHDPPVLVLDEPGSNLDPAGQDWLEGWVRGRAASGCTVVLATNDRREMEWGTRHVALGA